MYLEGPVLSYLDDLSARKPTPGGGSAAAAAGAIGAGALAMAANFTLGREKYRNVETQMKEILKRVEKARGRLQELIDEDSKAYAGISEAFKLPRGNPGQTTARAEAVQAALRTAMRVPLECSRILAHLMDECVPLFEKGNSNLLSDVTVGAELAAGACRASCVNVEVNLAQIKDAELAETVRAELAEILEHVEAVRQKITALTKEHFS
ncbi:MAG: cyclodeaminase/cyclohydrolase family protein [Kiritimatiellia bacterium]